MIRALMLAAVVLVTVGCSSVPRAGNTPAPRQQRPTSAPVSVHIDTQPSVHVDATPLPVPSVGYTGDVASVVATAKSWLGVPYHWGGCTKSGVDCSCFVRNVLATIGINAPRVTYQQIAWATPVSNPQPLDLVFFDNTCSQCGPNPTHVGLYLGGGMMIDAGDPVRIEPIYSGHNARYGRPPGL
jgi:N-acetylmuramoyl-L-alanine amidase